MISGLHRALVGRLKSVANNGFLRSVGMLAGGAAGAQLAMIAALPLLTRIYSPEDFSILGVYTALLGVLSIIACIGFDNAIPIPESDSEGVNLLSLSLLIASVNGSMLAVVVFIWPNEIGAILRQPPLVPYLWLLPVGVFLSGAYSAVRFWTARRRDFRSIGTSQIVQAGGGIGAQLGLGVLGLVPFGLLFGQLINNGAGVLTLSYRLLRREHGVLSSISLAGMRSAFFSHSHFARYTTPGMLANSAGVQLPLIVIAAIAAGPEAGFLLLAMRIIQAPMGLIGTAISQVYYAEAPRAFRAGSLATLSVDILRNLSRVGIGPIILAAIIAPEAFSFAFGDRWHRAGELVAWMTPWVIAQFLTAPISMTLLVVGRQRLAMFLQLAGLIFRVVPVLIFAKFAPERVSEAYALSGFAFYGLYLAVLLSILDVSVSDFIRILRASLPFVLAFTVCGLVLKVLMSHLL